MSLTTLDIKEPGLNVLPPGVERHVINAGGLTGLQIFPDDEIEIVNDEGNQICEITCFDKDGKSELGILNLKENNKSSLIHEILNNKDESSLIANLQLKKRNLDIKKSKSSIVFNKETSSGEKVKLKSKDKCYVIFAAPQNNMLVSEQNPSSDLTLFIKRSKIINDKELKVIPDPIYDPGYEKNIDRQTSIAYQVKEGDYIQVISPTGRQCSDFIAFDTRKLDKGIEKGLDWQTTRTFMGNTFPGPGLFSKFYDTDHEPLVEVVRDTVGKHDTFNLACTSKYYEDAGYFGHPNCSDNLNESMSKFGVKKQNINLLVDENASFVKTNKALTLWLKSKIKANQTDLVVFFAGHGLASNDGKELYLLPQDSDPNLLDITALSRTKLFQTIIDLKPKSVTMFLDTCYSGVSRDEQMLLASARPIRIVADEQEGIPDNFTIFSASNLTQTSGSIEEAKHGIFSYYLMISYS